MACPVTNEASGESRKAAIAATSAGRPSRCSACSFVMEASGPAIPSRPKTLSAIGVSMNPGQMALTRMPLGP